MSTAVDELLQDFEDSGDEAGADGLLPDADENSDEDGGNGARDMTMDVDRDGDGDDGDDGDGGDDDGSRDGPGRRRHATTTDGDGDNQDSARARAERAEFRSRGINEIRSVARLIETMQPVLAQVEQLKGQEAASVIGNIEDHPEYTLLSQANTLSAQVDDEIALCHRFTRDYYSIRFPALEGLISNPVAYARVVKVLGNRAFDQDSMKALSTELRQVLDGTSLMIVTLEATRSQGRTMTDEELRRVLEACDMMLSLDRAKALITDFVQSRMTLFAPNLTALVGSLTAAQLLSAAGGLTGLSITPACNIAAWGSKKQRNAGMATNIGIRQQGYLYQSDIIRSAPTDLKKQAMRIVAAKLVLAARIDRTHESRDGSAGEDLRTTCLDRLEKLSLPPPNQRQRALPAPDDKPSRKRGGRLARKAKEANAMTELRKAQNRMAFGKEEKDVGYGTGDGTVGLGMVGQSNDGRIRNTQIDQRTRAKLSAKNKGWAAGGTASSLNGGASSLRSSLGVGGGGAVELAARGLRTGGIGSTIGTASSLAFTPVQGLELVDPKMQAELSRKRKAEDDRWFKGGSFTQVGGGGGTTSDGFKIPALPPAKRVDTSAGKMGPPAPPR
jgi:U4/U6 small nuclear ribonucleoprotein PRP31